MTESQVLGNAKLAGALGLSLLGLTKALRLMEVLGTGRKLWDWRTLTMRWEVLSGRGSRREQHPL